MPNIEKELEIMEDGQWVSCTACPNKLMQCTIALACCKCSECKTKQFVIVVKDAHMVVKVDKAEGIAKAYHDAKKRIERIFSFMRE